MTELTHVDAQGRPTMVDVSGKAVTLRSAVAESRVRLPAAVARALRDAGFATRKGPVFHTAIVAGVMAAKRTHELIPFCHPLGLERCDVVIEMRDDEAVVRCTVALHHKTGVEMEALTGASIAALTIYDMCKALSHEIVIAETRLIEKQGGKRTVHEGKRAMTQLLAPLYGLVLAGGASRRMGHDKAALALHGRPQLDWAYDTLARHCQRVFVSIRADQQDDPVRQGRQVIVDVHDGTGPIAGIAAAQAAHPDSAWLVLACDLPFVDDAVISHLTGRRDGRPVVAYASSHDGLPEPLCAIYEPGSRAGVLSDLASGRN